MVMVSKSLLSASMIATEPPVLLYGLLVWSSKIEAGPVWVVAVDSVAAETVIDEVCGLAALLNALTSVEGSIVDVSVPDSFHAKNVSDAVPVASLGTKRTESAPSSKRALELERLVGNCVQLPAGTLYHQVPFNVPLPVFAPVMAIPRPLGGVVWPLINDVTVLPLFVPPSVIAVRLFAPLITGAPLSTRRSSNRPTTKGISNSSRRRRSADARRRAFGLFRIQ